MGRQGRARGQGRSSLVEVIARWQLLAVAGLAAVSVALAAFLLTDTRVYGPELRDAIDARSAGLAAHAAMIDQQSGLRAYVITGDDRFLEAFDAGRERLPALNARVEELVGDDIPSLVLDVRLAQSAWIDGWVGRALEAGRAGGVREREGEALLVAGKQLFDRYRDAQDALDARLLDERADALDRHQEATTRTTLAALAVAAATGLLSWRQGRRLRRTVGDAMAGVGHRLDRLRSGDLTTGPRTGDGVAEIDQIHDGLDAAVRELAEGRAALEAQGERAATHNRQLGQVLRFAREVAGSLNLRYVLRGLCTATAEIARADRVVVWVRDEGGDELEAVADSTGPALAPIGLAPVTVGDGLVGRAARFGRLHGLGDDGLPIEADHEASGEVAVPMVVGAEVIGVLEIHVADRGQLGGSTVAVLESLAVQAATAVSAARLHEQTEVLALTDPLTRLPNRRRLESDLAKEVGVSQRYGRPVAFAMADVDHFKAYNDELGHQAADVALQALANLLAGSVRAGDTVYRYGGEEIAVLMRETDARAAELVADRLRSIVEHHFSAPGQARPVTISVGVAAMPTQATTAEALVAAADAALYESKRGGRNRVTLAST
ncbi:MAG: diguanylate cyclase [Acidimicrobiia bacterium]